MKSKITTCPHCKREITPKLQPRLQQCLEVLKKLGTLNSRELMGALNHTAGLDQQVSLPAASTYLKRLHALGYATRSYRVIPYGREYVYYPANQHGKS